MAKLSRQVKEIIKTILFLALVGLLLTAYVIYPLTRTKTMMGRDNLDDYNDDSLTANDPAVYLETGLAVDTFRIESDGLTTLACLYIPLSNESLKPETGTVILLHDDSATRDSLAGIATELHNSGFTVITYDQRASGKSTGKYHGEGFYESTDLQEVIRYFEIREKIKHPLYIVGWELGGEAALLASFEEKRIDGVIAIKPYLTTRRMQNLLKERYKTIWFPFYRTMMWWWYNIRSSYAAPYRDLDDIKPVPCPTLIVLPGEYRNDAEVALIGELSSKELLEIKTLPEDEDTLLQLIFTFINE